MNTLPTEIYMQETDELPNNPGLPVLVYKEVLDVQTAAKHKQFQHCFEQNGWKGIWKNGLYDYHHFHPSSHEVLGIASGTVDLQLGGEGGKTLRLAAGDLLVLPAGTGHKRLTASGNLVIIGAYPAGQENYTICRHRNESTEDVMRMIAAVPLPETDPYYGPDGPLLKIWGELRQRRNQ